MSLIGAWEGKTRDGESEGALLFNEDIVEITILNITHPYRHIKDIDEHNAKVEETANKTGIKKGEKAYSYKEGGISLEVAITSKTDEDGVFEEFDEELTTKKELYQSIIMMPPDKFLERGYDFKHERRGGRIIKGNDGNFVGLIGSKDGSILIDDIYPSPQEEAYFENRKLVKKASEITDDDLNDETKAPDGKNTIGEKYQYVLEKDRQRLDSWDHLLRSWTNQTEEQAKDFLLLALSSRLLLHDKEVKSFMPYYFPAVGMKFKAKVTRNGKYISFHTYGWNQGSRGYDYYSDGTEPVTEQDLDRVEEIIGKKTLCWA